MGAHHHHDHAHGHPHGGHESQQADRRLYFAFALTLSFAFVEAVGGWWSGSLALLGDAGHMLSDAMALGLSALAAWFSKRPPSPRHSYGLARAEIIAALINGITMLLVVTGIVTEAVQRVQEPQPVAAGTVITIASLGLLVNLLVIGILSRGQEQNLNIRGALLHVVGDMLGSVAAIAAGIVIYFTGWMPIDPILSLVISALILYSTLMLLRETLHILMEGVPLHLDFAEVGRSMAQVNGVASVHDLHIWTLASGMPALSAHVVLNDMRAWTGILFEMRTMLRERYKIDHVTLQPELVGGPGAMKYESVIPIRPQER